VAAAVKTRKGKYSKVVQPEVELRPTGAWGQLIFAATPRWVATTFAGGTGYLFANEPPGYPKLMARFLLKNGLELLALTESQNPFDASFNDARYYARFGKKNLSWDVGHGLYPRRQDLLLGMRHDETGPVEIHQLYEWELGIMPSGDRIFSFAYINHCFACNLSQPSLAEYLEEFNRRNDFVMRLIR
jgi:hypothetical protein